MNYRPNISVDGSINLKERVEHRMVIADVTAAGNDNMLSASPMTLAIEKQLCRLQDKIFGLDIDSLLSKTNTAALVDTIHRLDDLELISFFKL